jgi:hypothetical protein
VVNTVPLLSESLLSSISDRKYLSSMLKPLQSAQQTNSDKTSCDEERPANSDGSTDPSSGGELDQLREIRPYQNDQWNERYTELVEYRNQFGHCNVPYHWPDNKPLSQWVKRQRHQRKLKTEKKHSNLTDEREHILDILGFIWDSRAANWEERYQQLCSYHSQHGHCQVTRKDKDSRQLAVWLKRQRHLCRLFLSGEADTGITSERLTKLVDIGVKLNFESSIVKDVCA